jgi:hypothetical protein
MKNLNKIILSLFSVMIISQNYSYSHGECKTRNSCNWNFSGWQYWAKARVTKWGIGSTETVGGCASGEYLAKTSNDCAWQEALNQYGSHSEAGAVFSNYSICARGNTNNHLFYNLNENKLINENSYYEKGEYTTGKIAFNQNDVVMDSINISLQAKGTNLFSSFEIAMWLPNNEMDDIQTVENRFLYGKITLMNGLVTTEGIFDRINFKISKTLEGIYEVKIENFKAQGFLPTGKTNDNTLIEVITSSDAGIDEKASLNDAVINTNGSLIIYPNPSLDYVQISLNSMIENEAFTISIYNQEGKLISLLEENIESKMINEYRINLKEILTSTGTYFVLLKSKNNTFLQKIEYSK